MECVGDTSGYFIDRGGCVFLGPLGVGARLAVLRAEDLAAPDGLEVAIEGGGAQPASGLVSEGGRGARDGVDPALRHHAADTLAAFKRPRHVVWWPSLPRNAVGKMDRRAIRAGL